MKSQTSYKIYTPTAISMPIQYYKNIHTFLECTNQINTRCRTNNILQPLQTTQICKFICTFDSPGNQMASDVIALLKFMEEDIRPQNTQFSQQQFTKQFEYRSSSSTSGILLVCAEFLSMQSILQAAAAMQSSEHGQFSNYQFTANPRRFLQIIHQSPFFFPQFCLVY